MKTLKTIITMALIGIVMAFSGCQKNEFQQKENGQVSFWTNVDAGKINIYVDGVLKKSISSYFPSGAPGCFDSGTATIDMPEGTYSVESKTALYGNFTYSITWRGGQCKTFQL